MTFFRGALAALTLAAAATAGSLAMAAESLLTPVGASSVATLPEHVVQAQTVRFNRRALAAPSLEIELFGETVTAVRDRIERGAGRTVWVGHLQGNDQDTVIVTVHGNSLSGVIYHGADVYRLNVARDGSVQLFELELGALPLDDADALPDGGGSAESGGAVIAGDTGVVQDLLVVYNQAACSSQGSCAGLEADIVTAVAEMNAAYAASGIDLTMNLVGMAWTDYSGTGASATLSALRGNGDGQMDEVHALRDALGADIVSLVYDGEGCGIGYVNSGASTAFSVTDEPCLVGNRTMAHEIGHNQGARHDRSSDSTGATSTGYNFGYRRCNDASAENVGSPYFRTIMGYPCTSAPRVGIFSNPNELYLGVPQGIDTSPEPTLAAYNARTLNESAAYVAGFRASVSSNPPAAPSGLSALGIAHGGIELSWTDNASDETSFEVERSSDGVAFATIAVLPADTTAFTDDGLQPESTYHYRVRAQNGAGNSSYSNTAMATTLALPAVIDDYAEGDLFGSGGVSGSFSATWTADGNVETITEQHAGGPKKSRKQAYSHGWPVTVTGGAGGSVVTVEAWVSGAEGANFYYSSDGGVSWTLMFTVDATAPGNPLSYALPGGTSGALLIEARDASQSNGEAVDSLMVDFLQVSSFTDAGSPPLAPSNMTAEVLTAGTVGVEFMDNATDEHGFEIRRATSDPMGDCGAGESIASLGASAGTTLVSHVDATVAPEQDYWYWALAFNGAGTDGSCSNAAHALTPAAAAISLSASGYKVRGVQHVDLVWSGAGGATVDVIRDGSVVATTANDGSHTDPVGAKGGASYSYRVCEAGTSVCSDPVAVIF